ncbi:cell division protein FtsQ [Lewinella aquimaris]|uniref:Cell division protein FtsQ n=1 Tax=Neolewinella aquimaris TaxID=1835722 RepID=A0A840E2Z5_9BACT|nr:cell division protein FtsQ/DivIB [Neolewinella aquimaris]MBB4078333.1 cell division protein FtsQ [Neolewinella aquimaris]
MATKSGFISRFLAGVFVLTRLYGWIFVALGVAVLAISAITEREAAHVVAVRPVVVPLDENANLVEPEELLELLSASFTKPLDQLKLSDIDIERVEEVLEEQAFVGDAEAYVDAGMILNISVNQRVPLLRIIAENGQNYYLDREGVRLPLSTNYTVRVPVVTGNVVPWSDNYRSDPQHQLSQLMALGHYLRQDEFLNALIEQISVTATGELVLAPKIGDQVIYLGRYDEEITPERLTRLKIFYREGLPYEGWRKYRSFDLRYSDQVVAKKI